VRGEGDHSDRDTYVGYREHEENKREGVDDGEEDEPELLVHELNKVVEHVHHAVRGRLRRRRRSPLCLLRLGPIVLLLGLCLIWTSAI